MKNIPKRIFLQVGDGSEIAGEFDFEKLIGVTWSTKRKHKSDLEYILKNSDDKLESYDRNTDTARPDTPDQ